MIRIPTTCGNVDSRGADASSGLHTCKLEVREGAGEWHTLSSDCTGETAHGEPGHLYTFRLTATDNACNLLQVGNGTSAEAHTSPILMVFIVFSLTSSSSALTLEVMKMKRYHSVVATICALSTLYGCSIFSPSPLPRAELSNVTLCRGWDTEGEPIVLPKVVPPSEERICICGHIETNMDMYLQVLWSQNNTRLPAQGQVFTSGPFLNCIEEDNGFEPGLYGVDVLMGKTDLVHVGFSVGEEQ